MVALSPKMKLYVWADPYHVILGSSMVFAVANNLREAKKIAATGRAYSFVHIKDERPQNCPLGKPLRVVKLPCAEWHEWSE